MANKRVRMQQTDRAKQFMPYDALRGFREALREKEQKLSEENVKKLERRVKSED